MVMKVLIHSTGLLTASQEFSVEIMNYRVISSGPYNPPDYSCATELKVKRGQEPLTSPPPRDTPSHHFPVSFSVG